MGLVLVLAFALLSPFAASFAAPTAPPSDIEWKRAVVVALEGKKPAANQAMVVEAETPIRLGLVLEGTRAQLPVYCSPFFNLRIDGRAIADRLVVTPENAGLADAEVQWIVFQPGAESAQWQRTPVGGEKKWTLDIQELPLPQVPGIPASQGTVRFAAAVRAPGKRKKLQLFESSGFSAQSTPKESTADGPGLLISRAGGLTLAGQSFALARIPVRADAADDSFRSRIAMRPVDLVLGAIENQAKVTLPTPRGASLSSEEWSWLFEPLRTGVHRRRNATWPLVDASGRPIPNMYQSLKGSEPVKPGDVVVAGDQYAILEEDDGDQWLGEGDAIVHTIHGEVRRGKISELSGQTIDVLRPRSFLQLRTDLRRAGYGGNERTTVFLSPELLKAVHDFQRDRHLPLSGVPDSTTLTALHDVLQKMDAPAGAAPPSPKDSTSAQAAPR